jgi:S-adenosylmethionine:tRNA ribosyltransferase-isomerase
LSLASAARTAEISLDDLDYELPRELIAQHPVGERDQSRLMVLDRATGTVAHRRFREFPEFFGAHDLIVANDSAVVPARLYARKQSGGSAELLVLPPTTHSRARVLVRTSKPLRAGQSLVLENGSRVRVAEVERGGRCVLDTTSGSWDALLREVGRVPLPPYIRGGREDSQDRERYQTVYAGSPGSVAAPTAGLHFTTDVLARLRSRGSRFATITLHVGPGTFTPLRCDPGAHVMDGERAVVSPEVVRGIASTRASSGRVTAVGTTAVRSLESAVDPACTGMVREIDAQTSLFIRPGYRFSVCDRILTNFHLPRSTLLCLVMAFAGRELTRYAYETAVRERYRFYSYGDAMLIL